METRMQPRSDGCQRCLSFELTIDPRTQLLGYRDFAGNQVTHFGVPRRHRQLVILAESLVEMQPPPRLPERLAGDSWAELDALTAESDYYEMLLPSSYIRYTPALEAYEREIGLRRRDDPLTVVRELCQTIWTQFEYAPKATRVDSPIDEALNSRMGVCQDFSHIMIALLRRLRIPARYVSGYLFHSKGDHSPEGATHAWVEAMLPGFGWVGVDPTNNLFAAERHIRTAVGRDYADVPPTRGVFKGEAATELSVAVTVSPSEAPPPPDPEERIIPDEWRAASGMEAEQQQQQQQQ
jgi:transglutaminase-like putative cysteine protease